MTNSINLKWSDSMDHFISNPNDILADWIPVISDHLPYNHATVVYCDHGSSNYNNHQYVIQDLTGDFWHCYRDCEYNEDGFEIGFPSIEPANLYEVMQYIDEDVLEDCFA